MYIAVYTVVYLLRCKSQQNMVEIHLEFACYLNDNCGISVSHKSEGHVHEIHGHKTTSSEHGERRQEGERKAERKGMCRGSNVL